MMKLVGLIDGIRSAFSTDERSKARILFAVWVESSKPHMCVFWLGTSSLAAALAVVRGGLDVAVYLSELVLCWLFLVLSCFADEFGDLEKGTDNEARLGPITPMQRGLIDRASMIRALVVVGCEVLALGFVLTVYSFWRHPTGLLVFASFIAIGAVCVWAAYAYTIGEHAYGYHAGGEAAAFLAFGLVAVGGGFWLYGHEFWLASLLPASANGLLLASTISLNNIRDIENDRACGKITLVVKLGLERGIAFHVALIMVALICYALFPLAAGIAHPTRYVFLIAYIPLIANTIQIVSKANACRFGELKAFMKPLANAILLVTLSFCVNMIIPFA